MAQLVYPKLSYTLVGVLFKVHNQLGDQYQEKYYQRAVEVALKQAGLAYRKEIAVDLTFRGKKIGKYFLDFLIEDKIILELKAKPRLHREDFRQVRSYLKAKHLKLGLLVNFRGEKLEFRRILNSGVKT